MKSNINKNIIVTFWCQVISIIVGFAGRTIFSNLLGAEYLGINGLFSNILTMLSFVELGLGSAMVYKLYKPLKEGDKYTLRLFMSYFKRMYRKIALMVFVLGMCIIPVLRYIIDAPSIDINIYLVYFLFLIDTTVSYLYVYKRSLLIADQKSYVVELYGQIVNIIMNVIQIFVLIYNKNYYLYLIVKIFFNWINNLACDVKARKEYPFLSEKCKEDISNNDKVELKKNVKGLLLGKIASVIFDGTDNIFISMYLGVSAVGVISNYTLLLSTVNTVINKVFGSLTATIGNICIGSEKNTVFQIIRNIYFINTVIYGFIFCVMNLFLKVFVVDIWLGENYTLSGMTIYLLVLELTLRGIHYPMYMLRSANGMFYQLKYIPIISACMNIILDMFLGRSWGIAGIVIATIISRLFTRMADIYIIYTIMLCKPIYQYYCMHLKHIICLILYCVLMHKIFEKLFFYNIILDLMIKIIFVFITYTFGVHILYKSTEEYKYFMSKLKRNI